MSQDLMMARKYLAGGNVSKALKLFRGIVQKDSNNVEALFFYGNALFMQGDTAKALTQFEKALALVPDAAAIQNAMGLVLFRLNCIDDSEAILRKACKGDPYNLEIVGNLGLVLVHTGKHEEALSALRRVVKGGGATPKIMEELGKELFRNFEAEKAVHAFERLRQLQPDNLVANTYLASAMATNGNFAGANKLWDHAKKTDPDSAEPYASAALAYLQAGEISRAVELFEQALRKGPFHAGAAFMWAHTADGSSHEKMLREDVLARVEKELSREDLSYDDWNNFMFAAGKLAATQKNYDAAFSYYDRANKRIWSRQPVPENMYKQRVDALLDVFDPLFFMKNKSVIDRRPKGDDKCGEGLIFVFGMPRSGTTLTEQIIARNDTVFPGGEREDMDNLIEDIYKATRKKQKFPYAICELALKDVREIAGKYHNLVRKASGNAAFFVDKTPRSFMLIGMMAYLFPKARFINCKRNPVDTCLSNYFTYYGLNAIKYAYNLEVLGKFYSHYERLMKAWHKRLPVKIYDAVYEDMVEQPEQKTRALIKFCGFEWNDQYMSFQKGKHKVVTASVAQVRKPIYKDAVGRWRRYEAHLSPLLNELNLGDTVYD